MLGQKNYSFSIPESDTKTVDLIEGLKKQCKQSGQSFSWVVLNALRQAHGPKESSDG